MVKTPSLSPEIELAELEKRLSRCEDALSHLPTVIPLSSFAPEPIELLKPIDVVVQPDDDFFVATFFDANINASGESQLEAFEMLKSMIASTFRLLCEQEAVLGDEPKRQLAVLRQFIRAR